MTPDIEASEWLNPEKPLGPADLQGRVVVVSVFQMLCPGCVQNSLPQARTLYSTFSRDDLVVIGLHSVFEHHHVMTPEALRVFVGEYRLPFPIAIDRPVKGSPLPATMQKWGLNGTPTLMVFGRDGKLVLHHFGHLDDLRLGVLIGELLARPAGASASKPVEETGGAVCIPPVKRCI
ncbi:MAG: redoxin family protein [Proteobacteria bacterium]|nr:redoxin family protein [Pseudomonadota bacterium]